MGRANDGIQYLLKALEHPDCREKDEVYLNIAIGKLAQKEYKEAYEYSKLSLKYNAHCEKAKKILEDINMVKELMVD